jgi:hypothetical protein
MLRTGCNLSAQLQAEEPTDWEFGTVTRSSCQDLRHESWRDVLVYLLGPCHGLTVVIFETMQA